MEGTLVRTKKYLAFFAKSFCTDKVALCLFCLILITAVMIIVALNLSDKVPAPEPTPVNGTSYLSYFDD